MADDPGQVLLGILRTQAIALLDGARRALADAGALGQLPSVGAPFAGTALDGHLLTAPSNDAGGPLVRHVLEQLRALSTGDSTGLFGWAAESQPGGGARTPDGIAWAARSADVAAAVAVTAPGGRPQLELVGSGSADAPPVPLGGGGWTLTIAVHAAGEMHVVLPPDGDPIVAAATAGDAIRLMLVRPPPPEGDDPGVSLGAVTLSGEFVVDSDAGTLRLRARGRAQIRQGSVRLAPGAVTQLVPQLGPIPLDVDLTAGDGLGLRLAGSPGLQVRVPSGVSLPGLSAGPLDVGLEITGDGVAVSVMTAVALSLPGAPLHLDLRGIGVRVPFGLGVPPAGTPGVAGAPDVPDLAGVAGALGFHLPVDGLDPAGAGVSFETPVVSATGRIERRPSGDYAGLFAARVPPVSATAFGVLGLGRPASFAVVLSATFPPPGIQVGLGFALSGVGGVVGVNRRVDRDALLRAVADGTAAQLLFPRDLNADADRVLASLEAVFPRAPGRVVVGPMFQLSWGGRLVTGSFAVLLELPEPVRLSVLGTLLVAVPDPELPLVRIEATFAGTFDPQEPSFELFASVRGSIVGVSLTGDLYGLIRGGADPALVLSAGGFHPRYVVPAGVPAIRRLSMVLSPTPFIELRCQAYVAVTSNSLQFGARVELSAEVAECGLSGYLAFDVLVQRDPTRFIADASAGIAVRVFGERLAGINLDFSLEGPAPWRARGRGSIDLFLLSASFDFDESWGDPPPPRSLPAPDIGDRLMAALRDRASWVSRAPDLTGAPFVLADGAARRLAGGDLLHPQGELSVRQREVPLRLAIDRFDGVSVAPQTWDVADAPGGPLGDAGEVRVEFARGQFQALDDDRALSRPSFEDYRAGVRFTAGGVETAPEPRDASLAFETKVITGDEPAAAQDDLDVGNLLEAALAVAAAPGIDHPVWWRPATQPVTLAAPSVVLVDGLSLAAAQDAPRFATEAEAEQVAATLRVADPRRRISVAGAWEAQV